MQEKHYQHCGGSTLDKYEVKLMPKAFRDLDDIYWYIAHELNVSETGLNLVTEIENAILSLEEVPERGAPRKIGAYANKGYRQIFIGNYTVIYRVDIKRKLVIVVTVRYTPSQF